MLYRSLYLKINKDKDKDKDDHLPSEKPGSVVASIRCARSARPSFGGTSLQGHCRATSPCDRGKSI